MHRGAARNTYDGKIAGLYDLEETLGRGHFAVVKSARHVFTGEKVAVKVIDKSKLDEVSRAHLFQEVRCMKLVQHPNVVRLYEVIDTQTKLYLILELGDGGDLYDYIMRHESGLGEDMAREYFRQIVRAISYCHRLHVVHRDLKPENVVFFERLGMVKLTDFGFSNRFNPGQKLETSCGSLAYSAPEILLGDSYDAPAVDVWSLGVILYMLVCGQAPFQEANDSETLTMIMDCKYTMPAHVSDACRRLIARMLIREPERRASLQQIANDPWLGTDVNTEPADFLPLISREHVSEEDHALILQKMVNGNIASKEDILEALDKNEYNHITATYFLLAERKLRAHRQEQVQTQQKLRGQILPSPISSGKPFVKMDGGLITEPSLPTTNQTLLSVPRTPGDVSQNNRTRKCSIVQEEDDEDDIGVSGHEELTPPHSSLNRRGSRSEGKLNLAVQERLAESERRKEATPGIQKTIPLTPLGSGIVRVGIRDDGSGLKMGTPMWIPPSKRIPPVQAVDTRLRPKTVLPKLNSVPGATTWRMGTHKQIINPPKMLSIPKSPSKLSSSTTTTSIITESSTISIPIKPLPNLPEAPLLPKYKTMPSPTRPMHSVLSSPQLALNEIFEEGDGGTPDPSTATRQSRGFVGRQQTRTTSYEQRRSKFHKARTASCSSSDASDDDSESRKKRAHKLSGEGKPLSQRRDSHDDSSDSQDPSGNGGGAGGGGGGGTKTGGQECGPTTSHTADISDNTRQTSNGGGGTGGRRQCCGSQQPFGRRHRAGRRRAGETRLRESQSLNRITEVQEAETVCHMHTVTSTPSAVSTTITSSYTSTKTRSFGARLLQGWSLTTTTSKKSVLEEKNKNLNRNSQHLDPEDSRLLGSCSESKDDGKKVKLPKGGGVVPEREAESLEAKKSTTNCCGEGKENCKVPTLKPEKQKSGKKVRLLGRYFQVHKKLCLPLPGLFSRGRLYKAQSCGAIVRDRVTPPTTASVVLCGEDGWCGDDKVSGDGEANRNLGLVRSTPRLDTIVPLVTTCPGVSICNFHLRDGSKCCHLC